MPQLSFSDPEGQAKKCRATCHEAFPDIVCGWRLAVSPVSDQPIEWSLQTPDLWRSSKCWRI